MRKKTKIVLGSLVVLLILYMLLPTQIQNPGAW